eukprot:m.1183878 g.1183878  ORF g.1183878 m.1183878 type:complete len:169 (+) comp24540_c1_seq88:1840-2346(+)
MHVARLCGPLTMFLNVLTGFSVKVPWPMQLMFNEEAIAKYNSLFSFLLRVNRLQYGLHRVWADNMRRIKRNRVADKTSTNARLLSLRARMSFLVDNLQYYLQVDVLDAQYALFTDAIDRCRDFDAITQAHDHFLTTLLTQVRIAREILCNIFCCYRVTPYTRVGLLFR